MVIETDLAFTTSRARLALLLRRRVGSQREDSDFDRMMRHKTFQIVAFSFFGIIVMLAGILGSWSNFSDTHDNIDAYYDDPDVSVRLSNGLTIGQAFISASTFVTMILITQKYQLELIRKRAEWSGTNIFEVEGFRGVAVRDTTQRDFFLSSFRFWKSRLAVTWALEMLIHLVHPVLWMASVSNVPPSDTTLASYQYTPINLLYKLCQIAMFLRLYLIRDLLHECHSAYINRFEIVTHDADLLSVSYDIDALLTMKMTIHAHPTVCFVVASLIVILVVGLAVFNLERIEGEVDPNTTQTHSIKPEDAFWFAFDASRKIGFGGEFAPRTMLGRIVTGLCIIGGFGMGAIYSGVLVSQIPPSKELKQAMEYLHTGRADHLLRKAAAELIQTAWRRKLFLTLRRKHKEDPESAMESTRRRGTVKVGDLIMDQATATEQATLQENLTRFGLDVNNQGHKADRLYYAIKQFRDARKDVQGSFTQAKDVVVNQKMDAIMTLSHALKRELEAHQKDFEAFEKDVLDQFTTINEQVLYYRRLGHVAI